jgi:hypothetical protein
LRTLRHLDSSPSSLDAIVGLARQLLTLRIARARTPAADGLRRLLADALRTRQAAIRAERQDSMTEIAVARSGADRAWREARRLVPALCDQLN